MPAAKKVRDSDLAKLMKISDKDLIFKLQSLGVEVDSPESALGPAEIEALRSGKKLTVRSKSVIMREEAPVAEAAPQQKVVKPPNYGKRNKLLYLHGNRPVDKRKFS